MTHDDIIRMAREAGFKVGDNLSGITLVGAPNQIGLSHLTVDELAIFAALVAAEKDREIKRLQDMLYEQLGELTALRAEKQMRVRIEQLKEQPR